MKNWKSLLGVLLVFLLGALTGGLVVGAVVKRGVDKIASGNAGDLLSDTVLRRMGRELDLTSEQKTQIRSILAGTRQKIKAVRSEAQPKVKDALQSSRNEIRAILTPEQQAKFDKLAEKGQARLEKFGL